MKKILVPTDFSEIAGYAFEFAYSLASGLSAEIELIHIMDIPESMGYSDLNVSGSRSAIGNIDDVYVVKLLQVTKQKLAKIINNPKYQEVKITQRIKAGSAYKKIYDEIVKEKIDLIVMGTSGVDNWEQSLIGTTAERVVRFANCPVITMRRPAKLEKIKNIAYASDFVKSQPNVIQFLLNFANLTKAKIHLVKVNTPSHFENDKDNYEMIRSFAEDQKIKNPELHVHNHINEEEGIVQFAEMYKMDMIFMTTRGRGGFSRILDGSIAEGVVNYSPIPVLTCRLNK